MGWIKVYNLKFIKKFGKIFHQSCHLPVGAKIFNGLKGQTAGANRKVANMNHLIIIKLILSNLLEYFFTNLTCYEGTYLTLNVINNYINITNIILLAFLQCVTVSHFFGNEEPNISSLLLIRSLINYIFLMQRSAFGGPLTIPTPIQSIISKTCREGLLPKRLNDMECLIIAEDHCGFHCVCGSCKHIPYKGEVLHKAENLTFDQGGIRSDPQRPITCALERRDLYFDNPISPSDQTMIIHDGDDDDDDFDCGRDDDESGDDDDVQF